MPKLSTSDLVLIAYLLFLVPLMLVGFGFARRKLFVPHHKLTMTTITILNWILIGLVMAVTYRNVVEPRLTTGIKFSAVFIPTLHAICGLTAQSLATYLVIRMWFGKWLPKWSKVKNIKVYMRTTLALWLLTAVLGLTTWAVFNRDFLSSIPNANSPAATPEATEAPEATREATSAPKDAKPAATPAATASK